MQVCQHRRTLYTQLYSCLAHPVAAEAGSPREGDVANVGGAGGGEALIDHQRPLPQLRPLLTLGLPELLEFLHNVT